MIWFLAAALVAAADLLIKRWIRHHIEEHSRKPVLCGRMIITKYFNPGAMLGFLKGRPRLLKGVTVGCVSLLVLFLAGLTGQPGRRLSKAGAALMLGGALSNGAERLSDGQVTDYFRLHLGSRRLERLVFNIGDFCIFAGGLLAVIGGLRRQ